MSDFLSKAEMEKIRIEILEEPQVITIKENKTMRGENYAQVHVSDSAPPVATSMKLGVLEMKHGNIDKDSAKDLKDPSDTQREIVYSAQMSKPFMNTTEEHKFAKTTGRYERRAKLADIIYNNFKQNAQSNALSSTVPDGASQDSETNC
ncbi:uncharacterized protein LOC119687723 [Teleopsis dalmanni]|uniref:uncharacterized protein LOC119687723 n=1 Tax=Teleopsis dalmanni TaxID=139649 RepID=UPI0018CF033A|nr:uncharacterized protein LOC119687723 [Teleopsis dalmanni]